MNQYYLMSQLPSLDALTDGATIPVTEERFYELCSRFLGKKALKAVNELTLVPKRDCEKTGFKIIDDWNEGEKLLRVALGSVRANKMKKDFDTADDPLSATMLAVAKNAVEIGEPLEAEKFLNRFRLDFLESLRPADSFSEDAVFYYGLKLKIISRIYGFDETKGKEQYRNIYNSILNGNEQEAE